MYEIEKTDQSLKYSGMLDYIFVVHNIADVDRIHTLVIKERTDIKTEVLFYCISATLHQLKACVLEVSYAFGEKNIRRKNVRIFIETVVFQPAFLRNAGIEPNKCA